MSASQKVKKIIVASVLLLNAVPVVNNPAKAGVMQELVEVDAEQRAREEAERIRRQEEYMREAQTPVATPAPVPAKPAPTPVPAPAKVSPAPVASKPKTHSHDSAFCFVCKIFGSVFGSTVGSVAGLVRGASNKGADYASSFSDGMGEGILGNVVGKPAGFVTGLVAGGGTGLANGFATGITEGWSEPFTARSFTMEGDFLDYDPYEFLGGGQ